MTQGRNTTGGAINFIIRRPDLSSTDGYIDVGYGRFNDVHAQGAWEVTPIDGQFGVRAARPSTKLSSKTA